MLVVAVFALGAVKAALPARKFASELLAGEMFDRFHRSAAERTMPTEFRDCSFSGGRRRIWIFCNQKEPAAKKNTSPPVTVG